MTEGTDFAPLFTAGGTVEVFEPLWGEGARSGAFTALGAFPRMETPAAAQTPADREEILRQAHEQAAQIIAAAVATGAARVEQAATEAAAAERETQARAFQTVAEEFLEAWRRQSAARVAEIEREAARLVVGVARRVLHEHFKADEAAIIPVVREALRPFADAEHVAIIVAPQHQPALRAAQDELARVLRDTAQLEVVPVDGAEPYGCVVRSDESSVDARLEPRLHAFQTAIEASLEPDATP